MTSPVVRRLTIGHSIRPENQHTVLNGLHRVEDLPPVERWSGLAVVFNERMDPSSLPPGSAFTVTARPRGGGRARTVSGTGTVKYQGASVHMRLAEPVARDAEVTVSYVKPSANALRDRGGNALESFSGMPAANVDKGSARPDAEPEVVSVAVVSDPGSDRTYGRGDTIRVQVTFSEVVDVSGTPRLRFSMGRSHPYKSPPDYPRGGAYYPWADYESGSGTPTLTFAYTVKELDRSGGIAVEDRLELNGGSIESPASLRRSRTTPDLSFPSPWRLNYDANHRVDGEMASFQSAAVDGTALTLTFDANLDAGSLPAPGAFRVTVNGARRNVASGGVAISGATVTLTLASAVAPGDTVKVRYTKPSARPLQSSFGTAVETFQDQAVTNNTHVTIWSAMLTVGLESVHSINFLGCFSNSSCSTGLTSATFTYLGESYRFTRVTWNVTGPATGDFSVDLDKAWPQSLRNNGVLHVGTTPLSLSDASSFKNGARASWSTEQSFGGFSENAKVSLRLTTGGSSGPTGNIRAEANTEPASVTGVSVVSNAGADKTYGDGDAIRVRVTFDGPVDVTGTPRLKIDMDPAAWGEKWAAYESGSGTSSLTFVHIVGEPNISTQGIAVLANTLQLNNGTIRAGGADANLAHSGLDHDANHKVDWSLAAEETGPIGTNEEIGLSTASAPSVTGVSVVSSPASGDTYLLGETIRIRATFDQPVQVIGTPRLSIDMDPAAWGTKQAAYESGGDTSSLTFSHTVVEPNYSTQGIAVLANTLALNGGTIRSAATHAEAELGHTSLGHNSGHKVDWRPSISVADARANEGAGAKAAFQVSLSRAFTGAEHRVTVDYATADGTATAGEDYTATSGTLTFAAGEKTKTVSVPILDDAVDEGEETFVLRLSNATGARIADGEVLAAA